MTGGTRRLALGLALCAALGSGTAAGALVPPPSPAAGAAAAAGNSTDGGGGTGGLTQKQQGIDQGLAAASTAIEGETAASTAAHAALSAASSQLPSANAALSKANAAVASADATLAKASRAIAAASLSLKQAHAAQVVTEAAMARQHAALSAAVRSSVEGGPTGLARAVVTATDPDSLVDNQEALSRFGNQTAQALAALDVLGKADAAEVMQASRAQAQVVAERVVAQAAQKQARGAAGQATAATTRVQGLVATRASALQTVQTQLATDESNYAELDRESNQVADLIAAAEREAALKAEAAAAAASAAAASAAAAAEARPPAATAPGTTAPGTTAPVTTTPGTRTPSAAATPGPSGLLWPTPGPVTSPFGYRVDPVTHQRALHAGVDIGAPIGQAIMAAQAGTVIFAGTEQGYGNYTCIDHGGGFATCYAHQSAILVSVGQVVTRGQEIGLVGETGYATGPHLHFETRVNGQPVNPMQYF